MKQNYSDIKALSEEDMQTASTFLKKETRTDKKYELDLWRLMINKHNLGGDMPAVMFFI